MLDVGLMLKASVAEEEAKKAAKKAKKLRKKADAEYLRATKEANSKSIT